MSERIDASFEPESGYLFAHVDPERVKALMMECGTSVQFVLDLDHAPDPHGRRVLTAIDQLRRDLSGYHGQLKAYNDLQVHCDNQRKRIADLEGLYAKAKEDNAELKEQTRWMAQTDSRWEAAVRDLENAKAENAKLRELVRDMYGFIKRMDEDCGDVTFSDCFDYCKHDTAGDGCCKTGERCYDCRMRDLGIEVDK